MVKRFKKLLVPHHHNDYKPHLFREAGIIALFSIIFSIFFLAVTGRVIIDRTDLTALVLPKVLVDYTNEDRAKENFKHLTINPLLEKAAQLKADDMARNGYFAHKSPDGKTPWYWFKEVGYDFSYAGENLAVNFNDSVEVNNAWMNSPGHRENIMNGNFSEIGIATAEGMYQGRMTVFVVQLFGRPAVAEATPPPTNVVATVPKETTTTQIPPSTVLSEFITSESDDENGLSELFISTQKESVAPVAPKEVNYSNAVERILVSPTKTLSMVYLAIAVVILMGIMFMIFYEYRKHNIRLMFLGIGLLIIMSGLFYLYKSVIISPLLIA